MRKSAYSFAFLATLSLVATTGADDFSALLADLSYGDEPTVEETLTATAPPDQNQLQAAPTGITMPEIELPEAEPVELETAEVSIPEVVESPQVALQDPVPTFEPVVEQYVDLEAVIAMQESNTGVQAQPAGHLFHHKKSGHCDQPRDCGEEFVCTPYVAPQLPSSTFYQYFRSNKCNTQVWNGYQQRCRSANKHIHGTCDCFEERECCINRNCGEVLEPNMVDCDDCNRQPRRNCLPVQKRCSDSVSCDSRCDG